MFKAGFSRIDITPPFGTDISGYFHQRLSDGILDPLYANALAVSDGEDTVLLVAVDYIGIMLEHIKKIKALISERTGVPEDNILIGCLHQHTALCLGSVEKGAYFCFKDEKFINIAYRKLADAAKMALDDMSEAKLGTAEKETAEPIGFVRRYITDTGELKTNPSTTKYKIVKRCGEADNMVRLIRFFRKGKNDIALINFSTHPDVIGGTKYSADWPGFVRSCVEKDIPGVSAVFFTGCQGDSNHIDFFKPKEERIKGGDGYTHSKYMGRVVADTVEELWDGIKPQEGGKVKAKYEILYTPTNTEGMEDYEKCKEAYEKYEQTGERSHIMHLAYMQRIIHLKKQPVFRPVPLTLICFGNAAVFGFGGEAFTAYGQMIRELMPDRFVICTVCSNGYEGYLPTAEALASGGYEGVGSYYLPRLEKEICDTAAKMVKGE